MMRVYIAGPMRGVPEFNFPAFFAAEARLRERGHLPFNPARKDAEGGVDVSGTTGKLEEIPNFNLRGALAVDLAWICRDADAIYMLRGWENSTGAMAEWYTAKAIGLTIWYEEVES